MTRYLPLQGCNAICPGYTTYKSSNPDPNIPEEAFCTLGRQKKRRILFTSVFTSEGDFPRWCKLKTLAELKGDGS